MDNAKPTDVLAICITEIDKLEASDKARVIHSLCQWFNVPPHEPPSVKTITRPTPGPSR